MGNLHPLGGGQRPALHAANEARPTGFQNVQDLHGDVWLVAALRHVVGPMIAGHQLLKSFVPDVKIRGSTPTTDNVAVSQRTKGSRVCKGRGWSTNSTSAAALFVALVSGSHDRDGSGGGVRGPSFRIVSRGIGSNRRSRSSSHGGGMRGRRCGRTLLVVSVMTMRVWCRSSLWRSIGRIVVTTTSLVSQSRVWRGAVGGRAPPGDGSATASTMIVFVPGHVGRRSVTRRCRHDGFRGRSVVVVGICRMSRRRRWWRRGGEMVSVVVGFLSLLLWGRIGRFSVVFVVGIPPVVAVVQRGLMVRRIPGVVLCRILGRSRTSWRPCIVSVLPSSGFRPVGPCRCRRSGPALLVFGISILGMLLLVVPPSVLMVSLPLGLFVSIIVVVACER